MDLVALLRADGIAVRDERVAPYPGSFAPDGVMVHHTAASSAVPGGRDAPSLTVVRHGRSDLPGPLCNILIGVSGTVYAITDGRANDSGAGSGVVLGEVRRNVAPSGDARARGLYDTTSGNPYFYDVEVEHPGDSRPYPDVQIASLIRVCASICRAHGWPAQRVIHHREWTRRKIDMSYRGPVRERVAALLTTPTEDDDMLRKGDTGPAVEAMQHLVNRLIYLTGGGLDGGGQPHDRNGRHLRVGAYDDKTAEVLAHALPRAANVLGYPLYWSLVDQLPALVQAQLADAVEKLLREPATVADHEHPVPVHDHPHQHTGTVTLR